MSGTTSGLAQSVHTHLIRHAQSLGVDPNLVLTRFATERLLYRLSRSRHAERFVLKGALLLLMWLGETIRPTRDADLLGFGDLSDETLAATFAEVCDVNVEPDGMTFDAATIRVAPIRPQDVYGGKRVALLARLGSARIPVQVDVGIGDAAVPAPEWCDYPSLLDLPRPRLRAYRPETAVAEKAHAMVLLGTKNSRMRDFFDVYQLAQRTSFDGVSLASAIRATFERRRTAIPEALPSALTPAFAQADHKRAQWDAFLRKNRLTTAPKDLETVLAILAQFLGPVFDAAARAGDFRFVWKPGGPWAPPPGGRGLSIKQSTEERQTLRRFKPYPAYKDSGVEWLGEIPAHWEVRRLRFLGFVNPSPGELRSAPPSLEVSFIPMDALGERGGLNLETTKQLSEVSSGYTYFRDGDVLVAKITPCFENGKGAVVRGLTNGIGFGTTELHVIRPGSGLHADFLAYLTFSLPFRGLGQVEMKGAAGQQRVPEDFIKDFPVPLPPLLEQRGIAAFLDRATAKIDALVVKKERLIELLQEKRTALITQAVTKGLDPNAPMRDSGVEWLGEIPAHWELAPVYARYEVTLGKMLDAKRITGEAPGRYLRNVDVQWDAINTDDLPEMDFAPWERDRYLLRPGDLLVCEGGEVGRTAIWRGELPECFYQKAIHRVRRRHEQESPRFFYYLMYSFAKRGVFLAGGNPNTIDHLTAVQLRHYRFPFAPPSEQRAIAAFLDRETTKIDTLIAKIREGIDRLKEYRTALISAAVTGKIDVQEFGTLE